MTRVASLPVDKCAAGMIQIDDGADWELPAQLSGPNIPASFTVHRQEGYQQPRLGASKRPVRRNAGKPLIVVRAEFSIARVLRLTLVGDVT